VSTPSTRAAAEDRTAVAWLRAVASDALANWLVAMTAFFSVMGRTIVGEYVPVFLEVSLFVAAKLQHSPANTGYFALANASRPGPRGTYRRRARWPLDPGHGDGDQPAYCTRSTYGAGTQPDTMPSGPRQRTK
jgi:hypothetical protein